MTITKKLEDGKMMLALEGRLDTITAPRLQEQLIPAFDEAKEVTLDFSQLEYISSAGLRVLLTGDKTAQAKGGVQTLTGISEDVMEVFDITGFAGILNIE